MNLSRFRSSRAVVPLTFAALALVVTGAVVALDRETPASAQSDPKIAPVAATDRPYLEWEVSQPLPEPTVQPTPQVETKRGPEEPSVDESELMASLAAGPASVAESERDLDAPSPTALASNLSAGERAELLRQEVLRERPARRRAPGPRFAIAIVEDNCEPPSRPIP